MKVWIPRQTRISKNSFKHTGKKKTLIKSDQFGFAIAVPDCETKTHRFGTFHVFKRIFYLKTDVTSKRKTKHSRAFHVGETLLSLPLSFILIRVKATFCFLFQRLYACKRIESTKSVRFNVFFWYSYVGEISLRFEYFQSEFLHLPALVFISVLLDTEFCAQSNSVISEEDHRLKNGALSENTVFFQYHRKVISVCIRSFNCIRSENHFIEGRIKFRNL